jgi:hypothetical protein
VKRVFFRVFDGIELYIDIEGRPEKILAVLNMNVAYIGNLRILEPMGTIHTANNIPAH